MSSLGAAAPTGLTLDSPPVGTLLSSDERARLTAAAEALGDLFASDLERLVAIDSGSYQPDGVEAVARWLTLRLGQLGAMVRREPVDGPTGTYLATFEGVPAGPTVLLLGHADTVFEAGAASRRPFRVEGTRAYGPGVLDMKAGLLLGLHALMVLRGDQTEKAEWLPVGRLVYVIGPDEEIGSPTSTRVIEKFAKDADVALDLEGARPDGAIVSARAGMTHLRIDIKGRSAHAGIEPERGRSAVLEAAHKVIALHALNDRAAGLAVNAGLVSGGSRPNIVPDTASITVDVRARRRAEQEEALASIGSIVGSSTVQGTTAAMQLLANYWPMELTPASARLAEMAVDLAGELGISLEHTATGGASDANTTAALGVPSLDGLGPVGGHAHSEEEYLELDSVAPRTTFLAALLLALGRSSSFR